MSSKILVVDDAADILNLFQHMLNRLGFNDITLAANGETALALLAEQKFDLLILDIELPDINGTAILDTVQVKYPQLPVVMCSAHNTVDNVRSTWDMGAKGFLAKPISANKLKNLLDRLEIKSDDG